MDSIVIFEFTFFYAMFYRIIAFALIGLGLFQIIETIGLSFEINKEKVELSAMGLSSIFLGLLNLAYLYEKPESDVPKIILAFYIYMSSFRLSTWIMLYHVIYRCGRLCRDLFLSQISKSVRLQYY